MKRILYIITTLLAFSTYAQQDLIMYGLQDIPQSTYNNPSNTYDGNFFIGLPALSSNYFSFSNSGFAYSDGLTRTGDSLYFNFDDILNELEDKNFLSFNSKIDLLSFGFSIGDKTQLTFNVTENVTFRFNYPKDFVQFLIKGNTAFNDNTANFEGLGFNGSHYREYGLGISRQLSERLRVGLRAKYLYGMENIYSEKTDISLRTDPNTFDLTAKADIAIRTSGIDGVDDNESSADYASGRDNTGFGADLGANYELNDKISFNASILDLGYINWKSYTKSHINNGGNFSYTGIEVNAFTSDDTSETSFDRVLDSLEKAFNLEESEGAYTTSLPTRFYAGVNYKLSERHMAGLLIQSEFFQGTIKPSFTLSYSRKMTKWITLATSYSVINRSYNNLGFGFSIDPGPVQFYIVSDNLLGAFQPQHARHLQLRFGINLIFGREKAKEIRPSYRGVFNSKDDDAAPKEEDVKEEIIKEEEVKENEIESTEPVLNDTTAIKDSLIAPKMTPLADSVVNVEPTSTPIDSISNDSTIQIDSNAVIKTVDSTKSIKPDIKPKSDKSDVKGTETESETELNSIDATNSSEAIESVNSEVKPTVESEENKKKEEEKKQGEKEPSEETPK